VKIAVNCLPFRRELAGTSRYALNTIRWLLTNDQSNEYVIFSTKEFAVNIEEYLPNMQYTLVICPIMAEHFYVRIIWEQCVFPLQMVLNRVDILFAPSLSAPVFSRVRRVIVIHDMVAFYFGSRYSKLRKWYIRFITHCLLEKAERVITVSQHSMNDIAKYSKKNISKVSVIYEGVEEKFHVINDYEVLRHCREKYKLPEKIILYVGMLEPGKNIYRLIRAYGKIYKNIHEKLVIAGKKGWAFHDIFELVKKLDLEKNVVFTGYVDDEDLPALFNCASIFVYPSLYEGFGLPCLEAMACGIPVIASEVTSLPEVVGDAAVLVNPKNDGAIALAMKELVDNKQLREEKQRKGFERIKMFSWKKNTQKLLQIFDEIK